MNRALKQNHDASQMAAGGTGEYSIFNGHSYQQNTVECFCAEKTIKSNFEIMSRFCSS